ncbi:MAG: LytTR family transcriptional regulator [Flavihumibacter sp.]|nr:LytTR family transcriptional regulator [Flavihumibacter sp.]
MLSISSLAFKIETAARALLVLISCLVLFTLVQDYLYASFRGSGYYIEESLLFSSFWLFFIPLWWMQWKWFQYNEKVSKTRMLIALLVPILLHLLIYAVFISLFSGLFFNHQFELKQTFWFGLTEYLYVLLGFYLAPIFLHRWYPKSESVIEEKQVSSVQQSNPIRQLLVADGNRKVVVTVTDLIYLEASSPYVMLYLENKKLLHRETLKGLEAQLDPVEFVRVHKSCIVNCKKIQAVRSRGNGDYELELVTGTVIRLSRNYVSEFRKVFQQFGPQVTHIFTQDS